MTTRVYLTLGGRALTKGGEKCSFCGDPIEGQTGFISVALCKRDTTAELATEVFLQAGFHGTAVASRGNILIYSCSKDKLSLTGLEHMLRGTNRTITAATLATLVTTPAAPVIQRIQVTRRKEVEVVDSPAVQKEEVPAGLGLVRRLVEAIVTTNVSYEVAIRLDSSGESQRDNLLVIQLLAELLVNATTKELQELDADPPSDPS